MKDVQAEVAALRLLVKEIKEIVYALRDIVSVMDARIQHAMHEVMDDLEVKMDAAVQDAAELLGEDE